MRRVRRALLVIAAMASTLVGPARAAAPLSVAVEFDVLNTNTSSLPCMSDGLPYTVRGDLLLPASGTPDAVTLFLHGAAGNHWRYPDVDPVYDFPARLADLGYASVVIDMLGYGASDQLDGNALCTGSLADIAHQIVGKLRSGDYASEGGTPPAFGKVVIGGHSSGGTTAEVEAYSFRDVDGLILLGWSDVPMRYAWLVEPALPAGTTCAQGGEVKPNYTYTWPTPAAMSEDMFYNTDPAIPPAFIPRVEPDPCGERSTVVTALALDQVMASTIDVPVLVVLGDHDVGFEKPGIGGELQCARMVLSPGCTLITLPETGHMMHLERTAPLEHDAIAGWLGAWIG